MVFNVSFQLCLLSNCSKCSGSCTLCNVLEEKWINFEKDEKFKQWMSKDRCKPFAYIT